MGPNSNRTGALYRGHQDRHRGTTVWGQREKAVICTSGRERPLEKPAGRAPGSRAGPAGRRGVAAVFKPRHRQGAFLSAPELSLPVPRLCRVHFCCFQPPVRGPCHNIPGSERTRRPVEFGRPCLGLGRVPQVAQRLLFSAAFSPVPVHALASSTGARRPHGPRITAVTKPPGVPAVTPSPRLAPVLHPTSLPPQPGVGGGAGDLLSTSAEQEAAKGFCRRVASGRTRTSGFCSLRGLWETDPSQGTTGGVGSPVFTWGARGNQSNCTVCHFCDSF